MGKDLQMTNHVSDGKWTTTLTIFQILQGMRSTRDGGVGVTYV